VAVEVVGLEEVHPLTHISQERVVLEAAVLALLDHLGLELLEPQILAAAVAVVMGLLLGILLPVAPEVQAS
jgi:Na+(H+)/acetate symporter ActP